MPSEIAWTDASEAHIGRHNLTAKEVDEALRNRPQRVGPGRNETTLIHSRTDSGRYVLVVTAEGEDGRMVIVTACDMAGSERQIQPARRVTMARSDELADAREYYDTHDTSEEMAEHSVWVDAAQGVYTKPDKDAAMSTFAVRLPVSMLQALRDQAAARGLPTGGLIRMWLDERLAAGDPTDVQLVAQKVRQLIPDLLQVIVLANTGDRAISNVDLATLLGAPASPTDEQAVAATTADT
jgi:predicted DNA binding CopG/RHH family protein